MSFPPVSFLILYFLFRLYDDTKHSALSGAEHSFSCSFAVAQVPEVIVGVITASNRCSRCQRRQNWEVSSCRCFVNADQAHRTLSDPVLHLGGFLVHDCGHLSPITLLFPSSESISYCISPISVFLSLFFCSLTCENFRFVWVDFKTMCFRTFIEKPLIVVSPSPPSLLV